MKKKQHIIIAIAILAGWLFFAIALSPARLAPRAGTNNALSTQVSGSNHETDELPKPFTLKALSTFLLQ